MAVFLLVFFVMALPIGTFIAVQRLVRGRLQLEMDDEAVETDVSDHERMWKAFFPGDYETEYFWVRHLSWAVLVIICVAKEYGQVPTFFVPPVLTCVRDRRDLHCERTSPSDRDDFFFSPRSEAVLALPSSASCTLEYCSS